ncbi:MAG: DUF504 domain-containing protein [Thermoplasmata archaeon]|nr:DUF504 domain-containing protein [Thermoplasmata archaeon]MCJ7561663.1 RNA repair domain-containing protein [Thermoplasmata archaeon]
MVYPREALNRLRWKDGESLDDATIWYIHRGASGDYLKISGSSIRNLESYFLETDDSSIPYHRILRIDHRGKTLFLKDESASDLK